MADHALAMPPSEGASPDFFTSDGPLSSLSAENFQFLECLKFKDGGRSFYHRVLVLFLDFEYFQFGGRNVPLSCQVAAVSDESATNRLYYSQVGERLKRGLSVDGHLGSGADAVDERWSLEEIVEMAMRQHDGGKLANRKSGRTRVILVAHNTVAEWSMLADRDHSRITKRLNAIRKSPVTGVHPIRMRNRRIGKVDVEIFDTRLLAPAGLQSLAALSKLLGGDEGKIEISEYYKRNMDKLLRENPALFEWYGLRDTEVTAKLTFMLQRLLNELAFGGIDRPFKTLGSAAVKGFLYRNEWFEDYREALSDGAFGEVSPIIKRSYLGGLNMGVFRGDTDAYDETRDYIYVDADFANAYANAMARCAKIDLSGEVDIVQAEYRWTDTTEKALLDENLPPQLIARAKTATEEGRDAVEALLRGLREVKRSRVNGRTRRRKLELKRLRQRRTRRNRAHAKILRDALLVPNNRHLDKWVEQYGPDGLAWEIPGFAKGRFKASPDAEFPPLAIKTPPYGLSYVLEGETVLPAVEWVQAVRAGVQVEIFWSVELPVEKDADGNVNLYFYKHLKELVALRAEAKKEADSSPEAAAKEKILKEFINAFYGKTAQGLNFRRLYNPSTGEYFPLAPSELTEPSVAALVTAQVRAALAATLLAIEEYNASRPHERPVVVISATTDGLLIGLPCEPGYSVAEDSFDFPSGGEVEKCKPPKMKKVEIKAFLERFGQAGLLDAFYRYAPIKNLREMRQKLTGADDFLEIKHLADRVVSVKTRGQIGTIRHEGREYCTLLARYGHKIPLSLVYRDPEVYGAIMKGDRNTADAEWLFERIEKAQADEEIEKYPFSNLTSFKDILESRGELDLVSKVAMRRTNSDWDFKRRLVRDEGGNISPFSKPYENVAAMLRWRHQADAIRKGGQNATPERVEQRMKVKGRGLRARSGHAAMLTRSFLRGLLQGEFGEPPQIPEVEMAAKVDRIWLELEIKPDKRWSRSDVSNAKRAEWKANVLIHNPSHDRLLDSLCSAFRVDPEGVRQRLFATGVVSKSTTALAQKVAQAVLQGPQLGIEPFAGLHQRGALPGRSALVERLHPYLGGAPLIQSSGFPAPVPAADRPLLKRIFGAAGLTGEEARRCVEALSPLQSGGRKPRRNPSEVKCLEMFVSALHQPDVHPQGVKSGEVMRKLKRFGLSKRRFYTARGLTLSAGSLKSTSDNRRQIEQMAAALGLDATKFLESMLGVA